MKRSFKPSVALSAIAAVGLATASSIAFINPAQAFSLGGCSTSDVAGSVSCGVGDANQDSVSPNKPLTVNNESFFGISNWSFGGKLGEGSYAGTGNGSGQSGSFDLSSVFSKSWQDAMLVFKSGNDTTLIGYLLGENVTTGKWTSPYEKDVSHVSVYYREGSGNASAVPEPAKIAGIALAGAGLAEHRRRRRAAAAK